MGGKEGGVKQSRKFVLHQVAWLKVPLFTCRQSPGPDLALLDSVPPLKQSSQRHPGAATLPVSSLLDALKDDNDSRQPETFEVLKRCQ